MSSAASPALGPSSKRVRVEPETSSSAAVSPPSAGGLAIASKKHGDIRVATLVFTGDTPTEARRRVRDAKLEWTRCFRVDPKSTGDAGFAIAEAEGKYRRVVAEAWAALGPDAQTAAKARAFDLMSVWVDSTLMAAIAGDVEVATREAEAESE